MSSKVSVDLRRPVRYTSCYRTGLPQRKGGNYGRSRKSAMHKRNRHLVDHSGVCVAYLTESRGGTAYTVDYARKNGVPVINLGEK